MKKSLRARERSAVLYIQRKIIAQKRFTVGKFGVSFFRVIVAIRTDVTGRESAATKAPRGRIVLSSPTSPKGPLTLTPNILFLYQNNSHKFLSNLFILLSLFTQNRLLL